MIVLHGSLLSYLLIYTLIETNNNAAVLSFFQTACALQGDTLFQINTSENPITCINDDTITDFLQQYIIPCHDIENMCCCFSHLPYITVLFFLQQAETDFMVSPINLRIK